MVTLVELLQRIYEELVTVCGNQTSVSDPYEHVDVLDRESDIVTPFFGFEWTVNSNSRGMGGNRRVVDKTAVSDTIEYTVAMEYVLTVDLAVVVDGDEPRARTEYLSATQQHFSNFISNPEDLDVDVERVREQNTVPSPSGQTGDVSARATFEIEYSSYDTVTDPAAATVNLDVDVNDIDVYPEQY